MCNPLTNAAKLHIAHCYMVHATGHAKESVTAGRSHYSVRTHICAYNSLICNYNCLLAAAEVPSQPPIGGVAGNALPPTCHRPRRMKVLEGCTDLIDAGREPFRIRGYDGDPVAPSRPQSPGIGISPSSSSGSLKAKSSHNLALMFISQSAIPVCSHGPDARSYQSTTAYATRSCGSHIPSS